MMSAQAPCKKAALRSACFSAGSRSRPPRRRRARRTPSAASPPAAASANATRRGMVKQQVEERRQRVGSPPEANTRATLRQLVEENHVAATRPRRERTTALFSPCNPLPLLRFRIPAPKRLEMQPHRPRYARRSRRDIRVVPAALARVLTRSASARFLASFRGQQPARLRRRDQHVPDPRQAREHVMYRRSRAFGFGLRRRTDLVRGASSAPSSSPRAARGPLHRATRPHRGDLRIRRSKPR